MKKIFFLFTMTTALFLTSCEGDPGPPGEPGVNILGQVFETNVNFQYNPANNIYEAPIIGIPSNIEVFESDVILVYRLDGQVTVGGQATDVWSPIPQNFFLSDGLIIQYVFNHTFVDVELIIDGNLNGDELGSGFTNNQVFRIAVVPSEFGDAGLTMDDLERMDNVEFLGN